MHIDPSKLSAGILTLAISALLASSTAAQTGGGYDLTWSSLDCGATTSASGAYSLNGTTGQAESGNAAGGAYSLQGGFSIETSLPTDALPPDVTQGNDALVFRLQGAAPNPFAVKTAIAFSLANEAHVDLRIYDLAGRRVRTVLERRMEAGKHQVIWDGRDDSGRRAPHGIYMLRLQAGELRAHRKLALVP